jgi:hypothetical protein
MGNDDFMFDDENFKPASLNKKASLTGPIHGGMKPDLSTEANARKRLINKSARKDILEEIFGDDLFNSFPKNGNNNMNVTPAASKAQPQMAKRNSIVQANVNSNNTGGNKFEDLFSNNNINAGNNKGITNAKDPFDFSLDYEPSFLKDDPSNQYNTRRSRYLPSGKRLGGDNNSAGIGAGGGGGGGGWNQAQFKISDGNGGGGGMGKLSNANNSYVPSFAGSGKATDKKSKLCFISS